MTGCDVSRPFRDEVMLALEDCGFGAPASHEASIAVFDATSWLPWAKEARHLLDARERMRADRFHSALDHDTYAIAHAFWRQMLGMLLGIDASDVPLVSGPKGRPLLPHTGLATSLSHSRQQIAVAIAQGPTIGVDIECFPPRNVMAELRGILCTSSESARIEQLPPPHRERALLELWTCKEALLKAFGTGLVETLSDIEVDTTNAIAPPPSAIGIPACRVHPLSLGPHCVGAWSGPEPLRELRLHAPQRGYKAL